MRALARLAMMAAATALAAHAAAQDVDCANWRDGNQMVLNVCSYEDWVAADREMGAAWSEARAAARAHDRAVRTDGETTPSVWQALLDGQRGWLAYRDGSCEARRNRYHNGTIAPLILNSCRARLTRLRTKELRDFAKD